MHPWNARAERIAEENREAAWRAAHPGASLADVLEHRMEQAGESFDRYLSPRLWGVRPRYGKRRRPRS